MTGPCAPLLVTIIHNLWENPNLEPLEVPPLTILRLPRPQQEIYGMDMADGSAEQANVSDIDNGSECVICMSNRKDTTVLPCRHMCMCSECANQLRFRTNKCPICRETVDSLLHIKLQSKAQAEAEAAAAPS